MYIRNLYQDILPQSNPFIIRVDDDKEVFVIASGRDHLCENMDLISQYKTLYDTALDLSFKISYSLDKAIENAYSKKLINNYDLMYSCGKEEWNAYYYIENAVFRIEALWDILGQIVNIKYSLGLSKKSVYHSRIFSKETRNINQFWPNGMPNEIVAYAEYMLEEDDTTIENGMWKGNYRYVNSLRNEMAHQISISQSAISSYSFSLKEHPAFILKRVTENFATLEGFIYEICKQIIEESKNYVSLD